MNPHRTLSSYLVRPHIPNHRHLLRWNGFRTQLVQIKRANPRLLSRTMVALAIWCCVIASIQYVSNPHKDLSGPGSLIAGQASLADTGFLNPTQTTPALATVAHASVLPDGPTGQLLPPGSMAPQGTYANGYSRGQCTWYVAGRRQIPGNWGNAVSWYYHAVANRWSVGTVPAVAAIAWTPRGYYGHVALVEKVSTDGSQVYISEMNYRGPYIKSYRWVSAKAFKYIY